MAEATTESNLGKEPGFPRLVEFIMSNKLYFIVWVFRILVILSVLAYFIPLFWNPYSMYFTALMGHAGVAVLRLMERLPPISFTQRFLCELLIEDSFHYLLYGAIFYLIAPVTLVLQPVLLLALLHLASYSLMLLDTLGQNSWWGARILISLIEFQSRNILRLISFTEIFLMPFTVILLLMGRASLLTPFVYYQYLCLRYLSRRNPYTRIVFHQLRQVLESYAKNEGFPMVVRNFLLTIVAVACRLARIIYNVEGTFLSVHSPQYFLEMLFGFGLAILYRGKRIIVSYLYL